MNHVPVKFDERIAIIGAGVAGVATAAALNTAGYTNIVVYDQHDRIGGLWVNNYPGASVQSTPDEYEYPGYPYPEHIRTRKHPPAPSAEEVQAYMYNFCKEEKILDVFQFNTSVGKISKNHTTGVWSVEISSISSGSAKAPTVSTESFAFVVICTGLFSRCPNMIDIPGSDEFVQLGGGRIIHNSQWKTIKELENQNILIIGNGKSAADAAIAAAKVYKSSASSASLSEKVILPPVQCIRRQTYYIPRSMLKFKFIFLSRLSGLMFPQYYEGATFFMKMIHVIVYPIKFVVWRLFEMVMILTLRLPYRLWPKFGTLDSVDSLYGSALVTDERHLHPIRSGDIDLRITQVQQLTAKKEAHLSDGTIVPVDTVIMSTGWKADYSYLDDKSVRSYLDTCYDGIWMYRNIIPPALPGIAFVGTNIETQMNIFTAYVQAYWLVDYISHASILSKEKMKKSVERDKAFKRKYYPRSPARAYSLLAYMQHYHDVLIQDQGVDPYVYTGILGPLYNLVCPVLPETVNSCFDTIRMRLKNNKK